MVVDSTFIAEASVILRDDTRLLSNEEVTQKSILRYLQETLDSHNWQITAKAADEGFPVYDKIVPPEVYLFVRDVTVEGIELGSNGAEYLVTVDIFGRNDAQRSRLAERIKEMFRDTVPLYNYVNGAESDPAPTGEYLDNLDVGWTKLPHTYTASDSVRYRAVVTATMRRVE